MIETTSGKVTSRIIVQVLERNPRMPELPNHRVLMRFQPAFAVRSDPSTHFLQALPRKWLFLNTLDSYLRSDCRQRHTCDPFDLDLLLINIDTDGELKCVD